MRRCAVSRARPTPGMGWRKCGPSGRWRRILLRGFTKARCDRPDWSDWSARAEGRSCRRVQSKAILRMLVDTPPKISDEPPAKLAHVEVLPPLKTPPVLPKSVMDGP